MALTKKRFNSKVMFIVVFGIVFHAVFLFSIFDIYFRSPLVHGMPPHHVELTPPANRLVLFVADGLRADKFYEMTMNDKSNVYESRAPFLREIVEKKGAWGVSHTRVPTETRPGHVALIAGFYEDVSAVTKGWKANPVEFDHVFNESSNTWGYGSPDILPMFAEHVPHMVGESYPEEAEDFASDASKLDTWVFDRIDQLLANASVDAQLAAKLRAPKVVIFMHLLGLDTNGHAYRPFSKEYYDNIALVDRGIARATKQIEDFFGDQSTAYVFTSDHGMSNRGSHGDGERANTETPLVAWGAGVRAPISSSLQMDRVTKLRGKARESLHINSETPSDWRLDHLLRSDVSQADIAPLMSSLIGVPCPLNSVGVLPTDFLGTSPAYTSQALMANTMQIWEMFKLKSNTKKENSLIFSPFSRLNDAEKTLAQINAYLASDQHEDAQILCLEFIDLCLQGLNYFQTYDRPFLMTMITLGYFGWIATLALYIMNNYTVIGSKCDKDKVKQLTLSMNKISLYLIGALSLGLFGYLMSNESPLHYYLYCAFVVFFWGKTIPANILPVFLFLQDYATSARNVSTSSLNHSQSIVNSFFMLALSAVFVMELLVISYFERKVLSLLFIIVGLWVFTLRISTRYRVLWFIACLSMSIFPALPVDFGSNTNLVCIGSILIVMIGAVSRMFAKGIFVRNQLTPKTTSGKTLQYIQMAAIITSTWLIYTTDRSLEQKIGLPVFNQYSSWFLLISSVAVLFILKGKHHFDHWVQLCLSLAVPFVLLSVSFETIFFGCFIFTLSLWMLIEITMEEKGATSPDNIITQNDIRRAIIYTILNGPASFLLVIALTDIMNINFFFLVKDTGSWLEIGTSISHYAISNAFIILQLLLFAVSSALVPTSITSGTKKTQKL
eukprot:gene13222-15533_t